MFVCCCFACCQGTKLWCQVQPNRTSQAHPALPNHGPNHHDLLATANVIFLMLSKYTVYTVSLFEKENTVFRYLCSCDGWLEYRGHLVQQTHTQTQNMQFGLWLQLSIKTLLDRVRRRIEREGQQQVKLCSLCHQGHGVDGESALTTII